MPRLRRSLVPLLAIAVVACGGVRARAASDSIARARILDREGVRAYREERYNDAIRYFEEAYRLGGPPTELWNVAKCRMKLDQPEEAAQKLEEYLDQKGLSPSDRNEAEQQLRAIEQRHSTLTVASAPSGATVFLDGHHWAGITPASMDVSPGAHKVTIEAKGYEPVERSVDAKYGRAIIVDVTLDKGGGASTMPSGSAAGGRDSGVIVEPTASWPRAHRFAIEGQLGALFPRYGSVGGSAGVAGFLSLGYVVVDAPKALVTVGLRGTITGDSWSNTIGAPTTGPACSAAIGSSLGATALSGFVFGGAAWRPSPRWRLGGDLGVGLATWSVSEVGGDLFTPTCAPSPGTKPALHLGLEASYAVSRELRLLASPLVAEVQPAFDGARDAPKDASGTWMRIGMSVGIGFDLF